MEKLKRTLELIEFYTNEINQSNNEPRKFEISTMRKGSDKEKIRDRDKEANNKAPTPYISFYL